MERKHSRILYRILSSIPQPISIQTASISPLVTFARDLFRLGQPDLCASSADDRNIAAIAPSSTRAFTQEWLSRKLSASVLADSLLQVAELCLRFSRRPRRKAVKGNDANQPSPVVPWRAAATTAHQIGSFLIRILRWARPTSSCPRCDSRDPRSCISSEGQNPVIGRHLVVSAGR